VIRILAADGDRQLRRQLESLLIDKGYRVVKAGSADALFETAGQLQLDLVLLEAELPGLSGLEALEKLRRAHPKLPVVILSKSAATENVIRAIKLGAFDYLLKPYAEDELLHVVAQALETSRFVRLPVNFDQEGREIGEDDFVGRSHPMQEIYKAIGHVAPTDATVLIRGESGTGKELVARAIYQHSTRVNKPFVIVNCVAIPESLLESELFGYEKGAFTGADRQRIGKIEQADGGSVFLDEIGDIPLTIQSKLLRLLQEKTIERIGGAAPIKVNVRVLAATNADLEARIREGSFREDLYYRINVVSLNMPPLRNRAEDIPLLADYFMAKYSKNLAVRNPGILPEAKALLKAHKWPGNVRELANAIEKCLIFSKGRPVGKSEVAALFSEKADGPPEAPRNLDEFIAAWVRDHVGRSHKNLFAELTDHVSGRIIAEVLSIAGGNRSQAARLLGISRPTLLYKMGKHGLDRNHRHPPGE
jgi:DNA-binding NtrC family response regulator